MAARWFGDPPGRPGGGRFGGGGSGGGAGGGGAGGDCVDSPSAMPDARGVMTAPGGCLPACCDGQGDGPEWAAMPAYGTNDNPTCGDSGKDGSGDSTTSLFTLGGTTQVVGTSPLALDYWVELSIIPPEARILEAWALYRFSPLFGQTATFTDPGGQKNSTDGDATIPWSGAGLGGIKAAGRGRFDIHATVSWGGGLGGSFFALEFHVRWSTGSGGS